MTLENDNKILSEELKTAQEEMESIQEEMAHDEISIAESDESDLDRLATAMEKEQEESQKELEAQVNLDSKEAKEELEQQIKEDELLEAELKKEAEEEVDPLDPELLAALPSQDEDGKYDLNELQSCLDVLFFMSDRPVNMKRIQDFLTLSIPKEEILEAIDLLKQHYENSVHGYTLMEINGGYQLRTKPIRAALIRKLSKVQTQRLSRGAMETLAITAYRQPVMKEDIDKVRGVDSSHFIRGLMDKKLIAITGRSELPGRPMLYSTTSHFLEVFALNKIEDLPPLRELEQMIPTSEATEEDPKILAMRKLVSQMKEDKERISFDPKEDEKILGELKENVKSISASTPYLDAQNLLEKEAKDGTLSEEDQAALSGEAVVSEEGDLFSSPKKTMQELALEKAMAQFEEETDAEEIAILEGQEPSPEPETVELSDDEIQQIEASLGLTREDSQEEETPSSNEPSVEV
ncbi:MAG: SMC-Scp complex subunit ScpB [Bdellovibrionaceae bacterium]|nr:SMC-Scp complex subunit ScpB [Pseudobdellovibrionaceae bacterium]|tara:strand:- start:2765 stop:4159 length:1395 start_codon:yes stop_codon:yes gene_type:complete